MSAAAGFGAIGDPGYDTEHELVRFFMTERTKVDIRELRTHVADQIEEQGASPAVAIPIFQGDELTAFAVYGIHRDGTKLDPDEIETLEHLCEVSAQAYVASSCYATEPWRRRRRSRKRRRVQVRAPSASPD